MTNYTGSWRWEKKSQGLAYSGSDKNVIASYRDDASARVDDYNELLKQFADNLGFKIKIIPADVKTEESSLRKVWDRNAKTAYGHPENVIDYLRATIIVPEGEDGVKHLRRVMDALISHPLTIGYKDKFWKPEEGTGHRSFHALMNLGGHTAELKVDYEGMKDANDLTGYLRSYERRLKEAEEAVETRCCDRSGKDRSAHKLAANMEMMISKIRQLRLECHELHAMKCGLNELLNPAAEHAPDMLMTDFAKSVRKALHDNPLGKGLQSLLQRLSAEQPDVRPLRPH